MCNVHAGGGAKSASRRHFYGVKYCPVQLILERQSFFYLQIIPAPIFSSLDPYSLPFPAECTTVFIFLAPHPYHKETEMAGWDGMGMGMGCFRTLSWSHTTLAVEMIPRYRLMSQDFVSTLRWAMRRSTSSIKKAKAGCVGLSHPQMLFCSLGKSAQTQQNLWPYG